MGLDQFLFKKSSIYANYDFEGIKGTLELTKTTSGNVTSPIPIKLNRVTEITEQVMYWRKSNHIHKWFVDNIQNGVDDCGDYDVTIEQLKELLKLCKKVQKDHSQADELLPTQSGFFFGGTNYDEWYFQDIDETVKALTNIIKEDKADTSGVWTRYTYSSSW